MMRISRRSGWVLVAAAVAACLTDEGSIVLPASFTKVTATDGQTGVAGGRLAMPFEVSVLAEDGSGVVRIAVNWEALETAGGASLSDASTVTDGSGRAKVWLTLGSAPGTYTVRAALAGDPSQSVTFTATALAAPTIAAINPTTFTAGDVITVSGTGFTAATRFTVAGAEAGFAGNTTASTATIVVPSCLPVGTVAVEAVLQGVHSNPVAGTLVGTTAPIALAVGEYLSVGAAEVQGCATLPAAGPLGSEYTIAPQSVTPDPNLQVSYRLRSGAGATPIVRAAAPPRAMTFAQRFHAEIREMEWEMSADRRPLATPPAPAAAAAPVLVGQIREFNACSNFPCRSTTDFETVRAEAKFVGQHAAIYLDLDAPAEGFTAADFAALGAVFDDMLYEVDTDAFGAESDLDQNGLVLILMTPAVNALTDTAECAQSYVTGFFLPIDLDPLYHGDPRSNAGEIFYAFVPDPQGTVTCQHPVSRVRSSVPVTFVHEFQHMISYYQHVVLRGGRSEILWLNEGMSHLAEELAGHAFREAGDNDAFSRYVIGDLVNSYKYLRDPGGVFLLASEGGGSLEERGAAWLFLRWLLDRVGDDVTRRLIETTKRGSANVEDASGLPMTELLPEWFLANWVSDLLADSLVSPDLRYQTWSFRTTFGSLHEQAPKTFDAPFPIEPVMLTVPFDVTGVLHSGSGDYYRIVQRANGPAIPLEFVNIGGAPLSPEAGPRLNIFRVR